MFTQIFPKPQSLSNALKSLDPELHIEIGPENVKNPSAVEFAVDWKNTEGHLLNYPNLKAISSYGHGVDNLLSELNYPWDPHFTFKRSNNG
ncbi:MAG: hypothetical protein Ct9H300mP28_35540 [Pseudomonadota bacterium]|nr:MAG: hypothetical protein Ct9H300mP28_35540 [Pseudomonadota bacterium]